jgi:hypothetical protein
MVHMPQNSRYHIGIFLLLVSLLIAPSADASDSLVLIGTVTGEVSGDQFGVAVAGNGDVNKDGYPDLLIGASANDAGGNAAGKAYLHFGGPSFNDVPVWVCLGRSGDFLGSSVAIVGDVNNDGFDDVLVGAPFNSDLGTQTGKAVFFFGGNPTDTVADLVFYGQGALDQFGAAVAGLGDINGDGYADWAIGAFKADAGAQTDIGKVCVYLGGPAPDAVPDLTIIGKADGERFGCAIGKVGRFDGDSYGDFVVGAYGYDVALKTNVGRAYVFRGGNPPDTIADWIMTGENGHDYFGYSVAGVGDVNGDSFDDILVGAKGYDFGLSIDAGKVYMFLGGALPDNVADFTDAANQDNDDQYGFAVSGAGDLDADGRSEFLGGADCDSSDGTATGKVYLYRGMTPPPFPRDTTLKGATTGSRFGNAVASMGPMIDHLHGAFAVGAVDYSAARGRVYIYGSVDTTHTSICACPNQGDVDVVNSPGVVDVMDVIEEIAIAFSGNTDPQDAGCPTTRGDVDRVNSPGVTDVMDVIKIIGIAFSGDTYDEPCP